jgi:hypothetical protein
MEQNSIEGAFAVNSNMTNAMYDGLYDVNKDGKANFIDAVKTWVNRD